MSQEPARKPKYVIDTSALLDLARWFPRSIAPGAWDKLEALIADGQVISSSEVLEELEARDDSLLAWGKERSAMFVPPTSDVQRLVKQILAESPRLIDPRKRKSSADPFVIAVAELNRCTVVAQEHAAPQGQRPKIPNVCHLRGVPHLNLVQMLEAEGVRLILDE